MARRTSSAEANASLTDVSPEPDSPYRTCIEVRMSVRIRCGAKAATTMMSGNRDTNALEANATLRSTNSFSSSRSHTRHTMVPSAQSWTVSTRAFRHGSTRR